MPISTRRFHRYVYRFEVLTETPIHPDTSLNAILEDCDTGDSVGMELGYTHTEIGARAAARKLAAMGSDAGFFQLASNGGEAE